MHFKGGHYDVSEGYFHRIFSATDSANMEFVLNVVN